jgi:hypothetical protein
LGEYRHRHDHADDEQDGSRDAPQDPAMDLSIPTEALPRSGQTRREFLRRAGVLGAAAGIAGAGIRFVGTSASHAAAPASAMPTQNAGSKQPRPDEGAAPNDFEWLAGDHHIHTQYSPDGLYQVMQQVEHATTYGLDWMVITDHGGADHEKFSVDLIHPDIVASRAAYKDLLIFQGFEWNIPAAEHGTVFVAPGPNEKDVLKVFEGSFDGAVRDWVEASNANEQHALDAVAWLQQAIKTRLIDDALFLANHPARKGLDSPHEVRNWRDTAPQVAVGMEGAPGHQAEGVVAPVGAGDGRGSYDKRPTADSFAGYPIESYRTFGGFDWMTSTVGGFWDSLLAEGKGWWITANSDSHKNWRDTWGHTGRFSGGHWPDPTDAFAAIVSSGAFAPGQYSRTVVGAQNRGYRAVMEGIRRGRIWVVHGGLIRDLAVTAHGDGYRTTLGGTLPVRRGKDVDLRIEIDLNSGLNYNGDAPKLERVDLIAGPVTGPTFVPAGGITPGLDANRDGIEAPGTRVVRQFDVSKPSGRVILTHTFRDVDGPFYVRVRGTDARRVGPAVSNDPTPPRMDVLGNANPWADLWFYSNPIFIATRGD